MAAGGGSLPGSSTSSGQQRLCVCLVLGMPRDGEQCWNTQPLCPAESGQGCAAGGAGLLCTPIFEGYLCPSGVLVSVSCVCLNRVTLRD